MKLILSASLAGMVLASSLSAQQILREDFTAAVPPAGWSQVKHNGLAAGWIKSFDNQAWHEDESSSIGACDNELISPVIDCSGYTAVTATFKTTLNWADWLANHPNTLGDGESDLYVRVNGGAWTEVWTDTRTLNTTDVIVVDMSAAAAGQSNVEFAFRYYGTYAHESWIDYVQIDGGGSQVLTLAMTGGCPGSVTLTVSNATANGGIAMLYGAAGSFTQNSPNRPCQGLTVAINVPTLGGTITANGSGTASLSFNTPPAACGLTVQAVDLSSCTATNTITL